MLRRSTGLLAIVLAIVGALAAADSARAVGYWNPPGSGCQCWGVGFGAGYHAKFVLGPITCDECFAHNEVRLPYAPQPPYGCCNYGYGCSYGEASVLAPSAGPVEVPVMAPTTAPTISPEAAPPMPTDPEPESQPLPEPEPVDMTPDAAPAAEESSALPPPPPASTPRSALFGPPVEW
jgi:hypothetical protein